MSQKHVVITGGATGIGAAIADEFATLGAHITLVGRHPERLIQKAKTLPQAKALALDITEEAKVKPAFETLEPVDILINNAGAAHSAPFLKMNTHHWQTMLAVNLMGAFYCTQACLPAMKQKQWGRIVFIASTAGLKGYAYVTAYCAAKHGVIGMMRALALETAQDGITVNAVCPGYTETELVQRTLDNIVTKTGRSHAQAQAELVAGNPQKRLVQPQEIAKAVAWLCSAGSDSITGQSIAVAGGEVIG